MVKFRFSSTIVLSVAILICAHLASPAGAQGNPTKTPKPSMTSKPSVTPKPSVAPRPSSTPKGFVSIPLRTDDFGGGGTILYTLDVNTIMAMDASGANDRLVLSSPKRTQSFYEVTFVGGTNTIMLVANSTSGTGSAIYVTDLKGQTPELLPNTEGAGAFVLSTDQTYFAFRRLGTPESLVAYDIKAKQGRELAKTAQGKRIFLIGWLDDGKQFLASQFTSSADLLTDASAYNVADGSSVPFKVIWSGRRLTRSPKGKYAFCGAGFVALLDVQQGTKVDVASFPTNVQCFAAPVWSPDEKYILFATDASNVAAGGAAFPFKIQAVNVDTKEVTLIKQVGTGDAALPNLTGLDWSVSTP